MQHIQPQALSVENLSDCVAPDARNAGVFRVLLNFGDVSTRLHNHGVNKVSECHAGSFTSSRTIARKRGRAETHSLTLISVKQIRFVKGFSLYVPLSRLRPLHIERFRGGMKEKTSAGASLKQNIPQEYDPIPHEFHVRLPAAIHAPSRLCSEIVRPSKATL